MQNSPEIENIIEQSITLAKSFNHSYVTIEHLLLALVTHTPFKKCLSGYGIETDLLIDEVTAYIQSLHAIETREQDFTPKKD